MTDITDSMTDITRTDDASVQDGVLVLSKEEARTLTDEIKEHDEELCFKVLQAYEGGAHVALEYPSWESYVKEEFGYGRSHSYRLMDQARVVKAIDAVSPRGDRPNEKQARSLVPIAREDPEEAAAVWDDVVREHGNDLTGEDFKQAARERAEYRQRLKTLGPMTRAVLEQADENFDKHRNLLRNSNQMDHLHRICEKHGDEKAAEVAEIALTDEGSNVFQAYEDVKREEEADDVKPDTVVEIVKVRNVEYVARFGDGTSHTITRRAVLDAGYKKCSECSGHGVIKKREKGREKTSG